MSKPMSEQMQKLAERYERATGKKFGQQTRADMVAVVRCKDCKHYAKSMVWCDHEEGLACPDKMDFCSYGERKDGASD